MHNTLHKNTDNILLLISTMFLTEDIFSKEKFPKKMIAFKAHGTESQNTCLVQAEVKNAAVFT